MTLKIETDSDGPSTIIRLIGRIQSAHLEELKVQIEGGRSRIALDLDEVCLVDVDVVRFLGVCQAEGVELLHCSPYISEWIAREQGREE